MKKIIHYDLFAGIGGFSYALDCVVGKENVRHIFVEIDPFCQAILKKHWEGGEFWYDIRDFIKNIDQGKVKEERYDSTVILTGGFPCQSFSVAGKRKGTADDRYLWPEMFMAIRFIKPDWVIAENVRGIITIENGVVFERIFSDLESEGYSVQAFIIPACAVGAPHRRDRVWIIGYSEYNRQFATKDSEGNIKGDDDYEEGKNEVCEFTRSNSVWGVTSHSTIERLEREINEKSHITKCNRRSQNVENSISQRCRRRNENIRQILECRSSETENERPDWTIHWFEVASTLCDVAYGFPSELVRPDGSRDRNYSWWRKQAIKAGGNAIVPQVAMRIFEAILKVDQ